MPLRYLLPITLLVLLFSVTHAQNRVSGTVFDSSRINFVPGVRVINNAGQFAITDSLGKYTITVAEKDSLAFIFNNKSTIKFAVHTAPNPNQFDVALQVPYKGKYKILKEVVVRSKSYKEDSIANREAYAKIFNFQKPTIQTSIGPGGTVGADANEIINMFRFKRNKRLKAFQLRLEEAEQEKYITYRFNKILVKRITHLEGKQLSFFMMMYRPTYEFASNADELVFNQYILNASYKYKAALLKKRS
jgi:hypothetical protein